MLTTIQVNAAAFLLLLLAAPNQVLQARAAAPVGVEIEAVKPVKLPVYAVFPGTVMSAENVTIASQLTGYVNDLQVHEGDQVKKGQLLLKVDPSGVESQIRQAQAGVLKARASLTNAETNYERYKRLYQEQSATRQELENMEEALKVAQGDHDAAQAALAAARARLKYAAVQAPFDGLVVSKLAQNGQLASPGTPLLVLLNPGALQVDVQVSEQAFEHLELGRSVTVRFENPAGGTVGVNGTVARLVSAANPITHTHQVKIDLPSGSGANSGEYALVEVRTGTQEAIVVPGQAIQQRAGITGVFVVDAQGRAQFRMVDLGPQKDKRQVVLSGLFPGDQVIVSADAPLTNGAAVTPRPGKGV